MGPDGLQPHLESKLIALDGARPSEDNSRRVRILVPVTTPRRQPFESVPPRPVSEVSQVRSAIVTGANSGTDALSGLDLRLSHEIKLETEVMAKTILITGTSTGIGYGAARAFTAAGYRVIATVRKTEDAERLKHELGENLHAVLCDVTIPEQVAMLPDHVKKISGTGWLDGLINNAGIEIIGPAELQKMEDIRALFETNVFGLIPVTRALLPVLGTDSDTQGHTGRIINISSIGGVMALPFLSSYAATKFAVEGYSHSLRRELRLFGVKVIILGPGAIQSAMWEKDRRDGNTYKGSVYETAFGKFGAMNQTAERGAATPESIGEYLRSIFEARRPKVRYVFTPGRLQNWTLPSMLPNAWLDVLFSRMMGLKSPRTSIVPGSKQEPVKLPALKR